MCFDGSSTSSMCSDIALSTDLTNARRPALFISLDFQVGSFPAVLSTSGLLLFEIAVASLHFHPVI
jgi:hypothetical protein